MIRASPAPVETFHDEDPTLTEGGDLGLGDFKAKRFEKFEAVVLVVDAVGHVDRPERGRDLAKLRLEDMRGQSGAHWLQPLAFLVQQRGLLLDARNGDPELLILVDAKRSHGKACQHGLDFIVIHWPSLGTWRSVTWAAAWQELHGAHAVAPDHFQQAEVVCALRTHALGDPATDAWIVGEQVIEDCCHDRRCTRLLAAATTGRSRRPGPTHARSHRSGRRSRRWPSW